MDLVMMETVPNSQDSLGLPKGPLGSLRSSSLHKPLTSRIVLGTAPTHPMTCPPDTVGTLGGQGAIRKSLHRGPHTVR